MAGESAAELARSRRAKAERLLRQAEAFEKGAEGERATAEVLGRLPSAAWTVFHDVHWPGRPHANIDHLVIGPPGVFVVDTKQWSGRLGINNGVLRQNGYSRERSVASAAEAALAVGRLVPLLDPRLVHPVLCFVRKEPLDGWARDVMVCTTNSLEALLASRPPILDPASVQALSQDLGAQIYPAGAPQSTERRSARSANARASRPRVKAPSRRAPGRGRRRSLGLVGLLVRVLMVLALIALLVNSPDLGTWIGHLLTSYSAHS